MRHKIVLTDDSEQSLLKIAEQGGQTADHTLATIAEVLLSGESDNVVIQYEGGALRIQINERSVWPIRSTSDVMGGDACIRNTRIPVWLLVRLKQSSYTDERILANYPGLTASDLTAAWDYYATHAEQVESERRSHEEAA